MKVLIIRTLPQKVDLNTYNLQEIGLAKALIRRGHQCDVLYCCSDDEEEHTQTLTFDGNRSLNILWLRSKKWCRFMREGIYPTLKKCAKRYDIIQVSEYVGFTSLWINRKYPNKVVNYQGPYYCVYNRGDIKKAAVFDRFILPLQRKKNMMVITKSSLATEYMKSKGIKNVKTIGVGLDLDNLRSGNGVYEHPFIQKLRQEKQDNRYLLYVGVLEPRRNTLFLLETFKKVLQDVPQTKLILVGKGNQAYTQQCRELMVTLGIEDKVICQEQLEQVYLPAVYEMSDIFVLPTRYEIFGMVLLEAMYFKLPVVTTYNGGSSTLMDETNGVIIRSMDSDIWSRQIIELLANDTNRYTIGERAHQTIVERYTWDALVNQFLKVYYDRLKPGEQTNWFRRF